MAAYNFKETTLYKKAFSLAMEILEKSKSFPKDEKYSLTDQIRRSSRSVCANLAEAYRKRQYLAHFVLNFPIAMQRAPKQVFGWILPSPAPTSLRWSTKLSLKKTKKSGDY